MADNDVFQPEQYSNLGINEVLIDKNKQEVVDPSKLSPWELIKLAAAKFKIELKEPRKGCKHCYGRGYIGFRPDSPQPIPCNCVFDREKIQQSAGQNKLNRQQSRKLARKMAKRVQNGIKSGQCDDILNIQQQLKKENEEVKEVPIVSAPVE